MFGFGIAFRGHRDSVPVCRDSIPVSRDSVPLAVQEALLVKAFPGAAELLPFFYLFLPSTSCGRKDDSLVYRRHLQGKMGHRFV